MENNFASIKNHIRDCRGKNRATLVVLGDFANFEEPPKIERAVAEFIADADARIIQFEAAITDGCEKSAAITKCGPNLRMPREAADFLRALGVDVALLANNHIGDFGADAALNTRAVLENAGIKTVGLGTTPREAAMPLEIAVNEIPIRIYNFCEREFGTAWKNHPGTNLLPPPNSDWLVPDDEKLNFVITHGGHEYFPLPSPRMKRLAEFFCRAGAAAVVNCHTHCVLPAEVFRGKIPLVHSLGNFFFPYGESLARMPYAWTRGVILKLRFDREGVCETELLPHIFDNDSIRGVSAEEFESFGAHFRRLAEISQNPAALERYFEAWSARTTKEIVDWIKSGDADAQINPQWPLGENITDAEFASWKLLRNLFNCETHADATATFLRLIEENRLAKADADFDTLIKPLQEGY